MPMHDVACVVFDAWAHKGDYLRRSFLESLIDRLITTRSWLDKRLADDERRKLSGHVKDRVVTKHTTLTPIGLLLLVAAFLFPFGIALITQVTSLPHWALWLGLGFCSLVPTTACLILLTCLLFPDRQEQLLDWLGQNPASSALQPLSGAVKSSHKNLSILATGGTESIEEKCYETPSPTPLEFQRSFARILENALADQERRLVIVIDNLDRVDPPDAKEIWSTLQTFFASAPCPSEKDSGRNCG